MIDMREGTVLALEQALKAWGKADIAQLRQDGDAVYRELAQRVDEGDRTRKRLVDVTRECKKNLSEDARKTAAPMIKAYQQEVDTLSKRSRKAEAAYLTLWTALADCADPVPLLQQCLDELARSDGSRLKVENAQLQATLATYQQEMEDVRNQEVTINSLKNQLKECRAGLEGSVSSAVEVRLQEVEAQHADEISELRALLEQTQQQLKNAQEQVDDLQAAREKANWTLFEARSRHEEEMAGLQAQLELATLESERQAQKALEAQRHKQNTQVQAPVLGGTASVSEDTLRETALVENLESELRSKEKELEALIGDCSALQSKLAKQEHSHGAVVSQLESRIKELEAKVDWQKTQLDSRNDYDEVKRQLKILKCVEFNKESQGDESDDPSLEVLLMTKNTALGKLVTDLNVKLADTEEVITRLKTENKELSTVLDEKARLAAALETDLTALQSRLSSGPADFSQSNMLHRPQSSMHIAYMASPAGSRSQGLADLGEPENSVSVSMLDIITNQRDRFKEKIDQLEAEASQMKQTIGQLNGAVGEMRTDNLKLYEKIKFLQAYPTPHQEQQSGDVVAKYKPQYEEHTNPFTQYNQRMQSRRLAGLSTADKATLGMTRFLLGSKRTRKFVFFYTILLHLLVLATLYAYSFSTTTNSDADCMARFQQHMLSHGQGEV